MNKVGVTFTAKLYEKIMERAAENRTFADFGDETQGYEELLDSIRKRVQYFRDSGVGAGSRVVIITRHGKEAINIFTAALLEGITPIILPPDSRPARVGSILKKTSPAFIFLDADIAESLPLINNYSFVTIKKGDQRDRPRLIKKLFSKEQYIVEDYPALLSNLEGSEPQCVSFPSDSAYISFSSGTTSEPKGVVLTHENLGTHLETITRVFSYDAESKIFNNMSLAHADGLVQGPLLALYSGALLYRPKPFTVQNLDNLLDTIYSKRITHLITVPTVISLMDRLLTNDDYFEGEEFTSIISVAARLDPNLWERFEGRFKVRISNMYGLTETVTCGLFCGPSDDTFAIGTVGKPIDMEIKIMSDNGEELPVGHDGELWMKGRNVTPGYLEDTLATEELLSGQWLRTGDLARLRADGRVEIVGRKKSTIISGGFNIHPDEINEVLMLHPRVSNAATVGIADDDWGELVTSAVELASSATEDELIAHCREHLEPFKVPRTIVTTIKELPLGVSGKVIVSELRGLIEKAQEDANDNGAPLDVDIIKLAARVFNVSRESLNLTTPAEKIPGWDSLGHLSLITATEESFSIEFAMDEMMRVDSLKSLQEIVESKRSSS